jgi:hypothetical protein
MVTAGWPSIQLGQVDTPNSNNRIDQRRPADPGVCDGRMVNAVPCVEETVVEMGTR